MVECECWWMYVDVCRCVCGYFCVSVCLCARLCKHVYTYVQTYKLLFFAYLCFSIIYLNELSPCNLKVTG